jgi:hypothetical protein
MASACLEPARNGERFRLLAFMIERESMLDRSMITGIATRKMSATVSPWSRARRAVLRASKRKAHAFGTILAGGTSRKSYDRRLADARKDGWPCVSRRYSSLGYDGGKLEQVTHQHFVCWQCPSCGGEIEQLVLPNTITPLTCPARGCQQGFQIKGDEVFVAEPRLAARDLTRAARRGHPRALVT